MITKLVIGLMVCSNLSFANFRCIDFSTSKRIGRSKLAVEKLNTYPLYTYPGKQRICTSEDITLDTGARSVIQLLLSSCFNDPKLEDLITEIQETSVFSRADSILFDSLSPKKNIRIEITGSKPKQFKTGIVIKMPYYNWCKNINRVKKDMDYIDAIYNKSNEKFKTVL